MDRLECMIKLDNIKEQFYELYQQMLADKISDLVIDYDMPTVEENEGFANHVHAVFDINIHELTIDYLEDCIDEYCKNILPEEEESE